MNFLLAIAIIACSRIINNCLLVTKIRRKTLMTILALQDQNIHSQSKLFSRKRTRSGDRRIPYDDEEQ